MPIVNGVITAGPQLYADIVTVLGVTNNGIIYVLGNAHGKIRWWAKYKPTEFELPFPRSGDKGEILLKNSNGYYYWQGQYGDCGLVPLSFTAYSEALSHCDGGVNGWSYQPPRTYYPQGDMIGYKHEGRKGIGTVTLQGSQMTVGDTGVTLYFNRYASTDYDLGFADIRTIKNCCFGAYLKRDGSNGGMRVINPTPIISDGDNVLLTAANANRPVPDTITGDNQTGKSDQMLPGTWRVYPFLFDPTNAVYYSIPYATVQTVYVQSKAESVTITITLTRTGFNLHYEVRVTNNTLSSITFRTNSIQFRRPGADHTTGFEVLYGEYSVSLASATVGAGASYTWSGDADVATLWGECHGGLVWVILRGNNSTTYTKSENIA